MEGRVPLPHPALFTSGSSRPRLGSGRRSSPESREAVDNATLISPQSGSDPRIDKEVPVTTRRHARGAGALLALVTVVAAAIPVAAAQDATPVAQLVAPA